MEQSQVFNLTKAELAQAVVNYLYQKNFIKKVRFDYDVATTINGGIKITLTELPPEEPKDDPKPAWPSDEEVTECIKQLEQKEGTDGKA